MGEAARRKKLNQNYGKIPSLSTKSLKSKEAGKITEELFGEFKVILSGFIKAQSIPENYQSDSEKIKQWVDKRLLKYHEQDRPILAVAIFYLVFSLVGEDVVDKFGEHTEISPLLLTCFVKIVKNYLSREETEKLLLSCQKIREREKIFKTKFDLDSIFEEAERELQLALNYPANDENWVFTNALDHIAIGNLNDCLQMAGLTTKEKSDLVNEAYSSETEIEDELYDTFFKKAINKGEIYIDVNINRNTNIEEDQEEMDLDEESEIFYNHIIYNPKRAECFRTNGF